MGIDIVKNDILLFLEELADIITQHSHSKD